MKFTNLLDDVLGQKSKIKVLRFLTKVRGSFTGRELARQVGLSPEKTRQVLKDFQEQGIVEVQNAGRTNLYKLRKESTLVKNVLVPLFHSERNLPKSLAQTIRKGTSFPVVSIILFGSLARGEERSDSDIDVLILTENNGDLRKAKKEIESIEHKVIEEFSNRLSPLIWNVREFQRRYKTKDHLLRQIIKEGIVLHGKTVSEVVAGDR